MQERTTRIQHHLPPLNTSLQFNNRNHPWEEAKDLNPENNNDEIEFQTLQSDAILYSPSLWSQKGHPSPRSRLQAIADGRRELMEIIKNTPDSSLELSLRDIVLDDQQHAAGGVHHEAGIEHVSVSCKERVKIRGTFKHGKISRSQSMDSGVFLLKMFVPVSLYSKKKPKTKTCSKISPNPPFKESEKPETKDWWKMIYLHIKDNSYSRGIKRSFSSISIKQRMSRSSGRRSVESSSLLDESSFDTKQYTSRSQKGCLF